MQQLSVRVPQAVAAALSSPYMHTISVAGIEAPSLNAVAIQALKGAHSDADPPHQSPDLQRKQDVECAPLRVSTALIESH